MLKRSYPRLRVPQRKSPSCRFQSVQLKQVVICRGGEIKLLSGGAVITRAVESQSPLKVQELAHEVKVWGDIGLFPFHKIIGIIQRQVELLH